MLSPSWLSNEKDAYVDICQHALVFRRRLWLHILSTPLACDGIHMLTCVNFCIKFKMVPITRSGPLPRQVQGILPELLTLDADRIRL